MLIKVTYQVDEEDVVVGLSFGVKAAIGPSYIMANRGTLIMRKDEWSAFQQILTRGAKRPTTVVIEQAS